MNERSRENRCAVFFAAVLAVSAVLRCLLSVLPSRTAFSGEELFQLELAQNLWLRHSVSFFRMPAEPASLLYPLLLSPFYAVGDPGARLTAMAVLNALLMTSALIPGWLLARRYLKEKRQVRLAVVILALLPDLGLSAAFLPQNLYLPLLLWGFVLLSRPQAGVKKAVLLGIWSFVLWFTAAPGIAFLFAALWCAVQDRGTVLLSRALAALAGFIVPAAVCGLVFFGRPVTLLPEFGALTSPGRLFYGLLTAGWLLYGLCLSGAFFPAALPVAQAGGLREERKGLLVSALLYLLPAALLTGVSAAAEDFAGGGLSLPLRALTGASIPLLLLFLCEEDTGTVLLSSRGQDKRTVPLSRSILFWLIPAAVTAGLPACGALNGGIADLPGLQGLAELRQAHAELIWLLPVTAGLTVLTGALLLRLRGRRALLIFAVPLLISLEILNGFAFTRQLRDAETAPSTAVSRQAPLLEEALAEEPGRLLILWDKEEDASLQALHVWLSEDAAVLTRRELLTQAAEAAEMTVPEAEWVLAAEGAESLLNTAAYEDRTPEGVSGMRLLRAAEGAETALADLTAWPLDEEITFGTRTGASYLRLPTSGFGEPEQDSAWTFGSEAVITLRPVTEKPIPLMLRWSWEATNPLFSEPHRCRVYAGEELLLNEKIPNGGSRLLLIPETAYDGQGRIRLRFVFSKLTEDPADPLLLRGAAFRSLRISSGEDCLILPGSLTAVEGEAFCGLTVKTVYIPEGVTALESKAFMNCKKLSRVYVPASLRDIAKDAFSGCAADLTLAGPANSPARWFAEEHGIPYITE